METRVLGAAGENLLKDSKLDEQIWMDRGEVKYLPAEGSIRCPGLRGISEVERSFLFRLLVFLEDN